MLNTVLFLGFLALIVGVIFWLVRSLNLRLNYYVLILNLVPSIIGLLLILSNLIFNDLFNIGVSLIFMSIANVLTQAQKDKNPEDVT
jgi:hypothetical protein